MSTKWLLYGMDDSGNNLPMPFDTEEELTAYLEDNPDDAVANAYGLYAEKAVVEKTYSIKSSFKLEEMPKSKGGK